VQELYKLGDRVENSTLAQIEWGNVILDGSDGEKILTFANLLPANTAREQKKGKEEGKKNAALQTVKNKRVIPRSLVQGAIADANQILTEVRVKPYLISGISAGYWVGNIKPGSIVEQMGFENGDIVKRVNGQILDSPEKIFQAYQKIQETGTVCVEVERNNQLEILEYEIRD
jgi:general secretion pathway protein C